MGFLLDTNNVLCFYTDIAIVEVHYHSCYQIVVSTNATFNSVIDGKEYNNLRGFIINKYTKHSCYAAKGNFLVYYIESKSFLGKQLKAILGNENFIDMASLLSSDKLRQLTVDFSEKLSSAAIKRYSDQLLFDIFNDRLKPIESEILDQRVGKAIHYIHHHLHENISLDSVADQIYLSAERTRHLFLEQVEVPFSQYVLWKRIKAVLTAVIQKELTFFDASLLYGFSDQSHFNRFFKRMFGISATMILKNSRFIQFIYPELSVSTEL